MLTKIINCSIIRDHKIIEDHLWFEDGKIVNPEPYFYDDKREADVVIDYHRNLIAPGFIDLQINGGFGHDFSTPDQDVIKSLDVVSRGILAHGVTSFCPTVITQSSSFYKTVLPKIKRTKNASHASSILGVHVEGPFISFSKKGAHPLQLVQGHHLTSFAQIAQMYGPESLKNISIMTMAPELDVKDNVVKDIIAQDITVSLGHSEAGLSEAERACHSGANFITHLFNAMLPFHHRDPGLIGLLTSQNVPHPVYFGLIADGIHTHETAVKIAFKSSPSLLVLVTDAISALGLSPGQVHKIGDQMIEVRREGAFLAGTQTLCGSIATMDQCVRNLIKFTGCSLVEAIECASLHPAQVLKMSHVKGSLDFGSDADFVILNKDVEVLETFIGGKSVWSAS